jgi:hypothetical protein
MDLLEFTFIEYDFFLSFSCATSAVASADANLSARNSIAQSFTISKFTLCVLVGMVSQTSLKLSYSLNGNFVFNWPVIGEYQAGFRSAKATMDQIFTVKNLLEKA